MHLASISQTFSIPIVTYGHLMLKTKHMAKNSNTGASKLQKPKTMGDAMGVMAIFYTACDKAQSSMIKLC